MTDAELEEIERRALKSSEITRFLSNTVLGNNQGKGFVSLYDTIHERYLPNWEQNSTFIIHAREDVLALAGEVRELRKAGARSRPHAKQRPYTATPDKFGGCVPMMFMGPERARVHMTGAEQLEELGRLYGPDGWRDGVAVYTYDVRMKDPDDPRPAPTMYVYVALVPVLSRYWQQACVFAGATGLE